MSTTRTFVLALLIGVPATAGPVLAQANCETYGKLAMQQQKLNETNKCGFSGPEWSTDLKAHIAWCGGVGPDEWKVQLQGREQQLAGCKDKK